MVLVVEPSDMHDVAMTDVPSTTAPPRGRRFPTAEVVVAAAAFVAFSVVVLTKATTLLEPDDAAYLASIVALTHGHLSLSTAQYHQVAAELHAHYGTSIVQWVHLPSGRWISEKNPGYPFYALPFKLLGILRAAPLFAAALASTSLFIGARRWLGRWGGSWAVVLFLASGAAMAFAWRPTMPSFTDGCLVAAGVGALLWTLLATDATRRRRTLGGLAGFVFLEAAVAMRYTDIVLLLVAVVAVAVVARRCRIPLRSLLWWAASLVVVGLSVALFNAHFYGGATKTGYGTGEITFSLSAIGPNLRIMPKLLVEAVPGLVLGLGALGWMAVRLVRSRSTSIDVATSRRWRTDAVVGAWLVAGWLAIWGLYSAYTWTAQMGGGGGSGGAGGPPGVGGPGGGFRPPTGLQPPTGFRLPPGLKLPSGLHLHAGAMAAGGNSIHLIRFYLPAIGLIALLGAWLLVQLPKWLPVIVLGVLSVLGVMSFHSLTAGGGFGTGGPGGGRPPIGVNGGFPYGGPGAFPGGANGSPSGGFGPPPSGARQPGTAPPAGVPSGAQPSGSASRP